jgi:hypothetical protein
MREQDVDILHRRHLERQTLEDIAADYDTTWQAVQQRVSTAEQNFLKEFGEHWMEVGRL